MAYRHHLVRKSSPNHSAIVMYGQQQFGGDPVEMASGALVVQHADLTLGAAALGTTTPAEMAPFLVATMAALDVYSYVLQERLGNTYRFPAAMSHRLHTISDPEDLTLTCTYDGSGRLATVTDAYGRTVTFTYTNGRLTAISDSTGRTVTYTYDSQGNLLTVADPLQNGAVAHYTFDARHRLQSVGGVSYGYDAEGRRTALTTGAGTPQ